MVGKSVVGIYSSANEAARLLGMHQSTISRICVSNRNKKFKSVNGMTFVYLNDFKEYELNVEAKEAYKALASAVSSICSKEQFEYIMQVFAKNNIRNEYGTEEKQKEYFLLEKQVAMLINDGFLKTGDEVVNYLRKKFMEKYF